MKVSVVVPVYGVERFIERCALSLLSQTLPDVEYIFVDDATQDGSIQILQSVLKRFPALEKVVRIVHHSVNQGLPAARNTGLQLARGQYVYHCDSDDFVEPTLLEELYVKAQACKADIVWCDWFLSFERKERYMCQPDCSSAEEALRALLEGVMKYNVWNKLVRRDLYERNQVSFPDGHGMGEDMTMIRLFACAKRVAYVPHALYHYVKTNQDAFTQTFSDKHLKDIALNVAATVDFVQSRKGDAWLKELAFFKLNVKYPFLISDNPRMYQLWSEWYPEANRFVSQNTQLSKRARWLQLAASRRMFWVVWLHYKLIYRFIYGVIYR